MTAAAHDMRQARSRWPVAKQAIAGILSYVPGGRRLLSARGTGGHASARYHYAVWLRHLRALRDAGCTKLPEDVAEIGPGDMLGLGFAALLSACRSYVALDAVPYVQRSQDEDLLDELLGLFERREPANPGEAFPSDILSPERLARSLAPERLGVLRALQGELAAGVAQALPSSDRPSMRYIAPWTSSTALAPDTVDLVCSQAAMEHVEDYQECYRAQASWLRPGGYALHAIDFDCHWTARDWNGHWAHSDAVWKLLRGRRSYLINRAPCSWHLRAMRARGLEPVLVQRQYREGGLEAWPKSPVSARRAGVCALCRPKT